jgi:hypothetical protein
MLLCCDIGVVASNHLTIRWWHMVDVEDSLNFRFAPKAAFEILRAARLRP